MTDKLRRRALLGDTTSRRNKIALLAQYVADGEPIKYMWAGVPYESRLLVSFGDDNYLVCKSYDEDIRPKLVGPGT